jgi:hypothetical protein
MSTRFFNIQLKAHCLLGISLVRSLTSIKKQHEPPGYLWGYMVDSSSNVVLLNSARAGFPRQFNASRY